MTKKCKLPRNEKYTYQNQAIVWLETRKPEIEPETIFHDLANFIKGVVPEPKEDEPKESTSNALLEPRGS